jgi:hypothetical protein
VGIVAALLVVGLVLLELLALLPHLRFLSSLSNQLKVLIASLIDVPIYFLATRLFDRRAKGSKQ